MRASTTSTALAEGALGTRERAPSPPSDPPPTGRDRVLGPLRWLSQRRTWKVIVVCGLLIFATTASVVYFGPVSLGTIRPLQNAVLRDIDGNFIAEIRPEQNRVVVSLDAIPKLVQNAFIAAEDERFWSHLGVDPIAIGRAVFANARGDREGASTITQQYVRNTESLQIGRERSLARKLREAVAAVRVDRKYSKEKILAGYLNSIYLGNGAYGVEAASRLYFGLSVSQISLEQAALLAGITANPTAFDPRRSPKGAKTRRNYVLDRMHDLAFITTLERDSARALDVLVNKPQPIVTPAPGFVDWMRTLLKDQFGEDGLYRGGLDVQTTLSLEIQHEAEAAVRETLNLPGDPEAALVVIDVATGGVRAMVGGRNVRLGELNLATQARRQAGSAFKPFVLASALEQGKTLEDRYSGPGSIRLQLPNGETWRVPNFDRRGYGRITLERALANSVNTVFAQLIRDVEPENVAKLAKDAGIRTKLRPVHSLALGTSEVTPLDLTTAYATLAREGVRLSATGMSWVTDSSERVLYRNREPGQRTGQEVIAPSAAIDTIEAMKVVVARGTGRKARLNVDAPAKCSEDPLVPCKAVPYVTWGKTGTTDDNADAWFCGGAGGFVSCVWVGYPEGRVPMDNVHGIEVVGSSFPATIWKRVMTAVLEKFKPADYANLSPRKEAPKPKPRVSSRPTHEPSEEPTVIESEEPEPSGNPLPVPTLIRR